MPTEPTVAILVNIVAPYRIPVYRRIGGRFRTVVFVSGTERNRASWAGVAERAAGFEVRRTAGVSIPYRVGRGSVYDEKFLHLPLGQILDLARLRPAAILSTEMGMRTLAALLYGTLTRTPVWVWWGGTLHTERNIGRLRRLVRAVVSRWAKRWISYGATSTEYLESIGVPRDRILQIQNCVDETLYLADASGHQVQDASRSRAQEVPHPQAQEVSHPQAQEGSSFQAHERSGFRAQETSSCQAQDTSSVRPVTAGSGEGESTDIPDVERQYAARPESWEVPTPAPDAGGGARTTTAAPGAHAEGELATTPHAVVETYAATVGTIEAVQGPSVPAPTAEDPLTTAVGNAAAVGTSVAGQEVSAPTMDERAHRAGVSWDDRPVTQVGGARLLYVGQMIRRKGVDRFLEAAARLQKRGYRFSALLVGDGPEKPAFEALAKELGLRGVSFMAAQPPEAMPAIYRSADCLVFPTCEDVWGLVVNEAMWSGLPVIASVYAGCARELLPEDQTFDPFDLDDFTEVLEKAVTGRLPPPDLTRLMRSTDVGDMIIADIERTLAAAAP